MFDFFRRLFGAPSERPARFWPAELVAQWRR